MLRFLSQFQWWRSHNSPVATVRFTVFQRSYRSSPSPCLIRLLALRYRSEAWHRFVQSRRLAVWRGGRRRRQVFGVSPSPSRACVHRFTVRHRLLGVVVKRFRRSPIHRLSPFWRGVRRTSPHVTSHRSHITGERFVCTLVTVTG